MAQQQGLIHLDDNNFSSTIAKGVALVDLYADWCGPCKMIAPIIEALASQFEGKALIAKLDIEKAPNTTAQLGVTSIPTIILFKDGKEIKRVVGIRDEKTLKEMIQAAL